MTRAYMVEEIELDAAAGTIYLSSYLSQSAQGRWTDDLRDAARSGSDASLAAHLTATSAMNAMTTRRKPTGGVTQVRVPHNAADVLAESEFNRFYVRGLCRRAIADRIPRLEVYRAKLVREPRPGSEERIGLRVDPETILLDVRASPGVETALGVPPGPGSGLSVRIPR